MRPKPRKAPPNRPPRREASPPPPSAIWKQSAPPELFPALLLVILTLAAFLPACDSQFVNYDDPEYITENSNVTGGLTWENLTWAVSATYAGNWHPLTWWSLQLDYELYALRPWGYHFTNVLIHTAAVVTLFLVLRSMTGVVWPAAAAAALFAVHPLRVESVVWVTERKDVLSGLFWMLTLAAYAWYVRGPTRSRYLLVMLTLALGLMAKPMLVTLPCVLLLLDYWPLGRWRRGTALRLVAERLPLLALAAVSGVITFAAQQEGGAVQSLEKLSLELRLANALVSYVEYLKLFLWPMHLAIFYPHPRHPLLSVEAIGAGILLLALSLLAVWQARRRPYLLVGWLWYLGTLVPVIGLVHVGTQGFADRYTYVPLIGIAIALCWALAELAEQASHARVPIAIGAAVVLAALLLRTWQQAAHWQDTESVWLHAAAVTRDNYRAHWNLAEIAARYGTAEESLDHYRQALPTFPNPEVIHNGMGRVYLKAGRHEEAEAQFWEALRIKPDDPTALHNLATLLVEQGRLDEAEALLAQVAAAAANRTTPGGK